MENHIYQNWTTGVVLTVIGYGKKTNDLGFTFPVLDVEVAFPSGIKTTSCINPMILFQADRNYKKVSFEIGSVSKFVREFETWDKILPLLKGSVIKITDMELVSNRCETRSFAVFKFDFVSD